MKVDRISLEIMEERELAPYGMRSSRSKGRAHSESEPAYRTCFQRDRDRILHTTAFRRLEYKTQVFITYRRRLLPHPPDPHPGGGADRPHHRPRPGRQRGPGGGHLPGARPGPFALRSFRRGDPRRPDEGHGGFDHNKQSLRIVDELEDRFPNFHGLNLTWEVREGIVKHESEYDQSDADRFDPQLRGHIEAQITNVADELAYTAHDLDDGLHSGMITLENLSEIEIWEHLTADLEIPCHDLEEKTRHRIIRRLIGLEVTDIIDTTDQNIQKERDHFG